MSSSALAMAFSAGASSLSSDSSSEGASSSGEASSSAGASSSSSSFSPLVVTPIVWDEYALQRSMTFRSLRSCSCHANMKIVSCYKFLYRSAYSECYIVS